MAEWAKVFFVSLFTLSVIFVMAAVALHESGK